MDALVALIRDIEAAQQQGGNADRLDEARKLHRQAQFLVDFIEAENSMGFHADQESVRILAHAIDLVRQAQLVLRDGDIAQRAVSAVSPIG
jgi:nitrite reductase (cytochrome c-552)